VVPENASGVDGIVTLGLGVKKPTFAARLQVKKSAFEHQN